MCVKSWFIDTVELFDLPAPFEEGRKSVCPSSFSPSFFSLKSWWITFLPAFHPKSHLKVPNLQWDFSFCAMLCITSIPSNPVYFDLTQGLSYRQSLPKPPPIRLPLNSFTLFLALANSHTHTYLPLNPPLTLPISLFIFLIQKKKKVLFVEFIFILVNHFLSLEEMITRWKFGIGKLVVVSLLLMVIWITFEPFSFILWIHGSFRHRMIKQFEFGIGSPEPVFLFWRAIIITSCVLNFIMKRTWWSPLLWTKLFESGISPVRKSPFSFIISHDISPHHIISHGITACWHTMNP